MSRASSYTSSKTVKQTFLLLPLTACAAVAAPREFTLYNVAPLSIGREATAAADAVDPSIPGGICVAGEEHFLCAPLARAFAANGQRPVMRTSTGLYAERMSAAGAPGNVCRMMGFEAYYNDSGIDLLCESDTCPHNLWSKSARSFFTHMATAAFVGMTGAKTWYVNAHKGAFAVSRNYTDVLAENPRFLTALAAAVEGTGWEGLAIPCFTNFPKWHMGAL